MPKDEDQVMPHHEIEGEELERWRIAAGLPAAGHELTEDWNPLEAGLWDHVSFTKGCYVGQEVVARLRTYDKVSREIVRLRAGLDGSEPKTLEQIGQQLGITKERVRQLNVRIMKQLRDIAGGNPADVG